MPGTDTLDRPVSSGTRRTAALLPAARRGAAGPTPDAGRPRGQARAVWFAVTATLNGGFVAWSVSRGEVGGRAVEWSLAAFCIAVAARHDGIVRAAFVLGRLIRSYRLLPAESASWIEGEFAVTAPRRMAGSGHFRQVALSAAGSS
jgi:hypothetical protein